MKHYTNIKPEQQIACSQGSSELFPESATCKNLATTYLHDGLPYCDQCASNLLEIHRKFMTCQD